MIEKTASIQKPSDFNKGLITLIGFALIAIGSGTLLYLIFNFMHLLENLSENPVHAYIVSFDPETHPIFFGEQEIKFPKEWLRIIALVLGVLVLYVWISIGSNFISVGSSLLSKNNQNEKNLAQPNQFSESNY